MASINAEAESRAASWYGRAFGLVVAAPEAIETLSECPPGSHAATTAWRRVASSDELGAEWPGVDVKPLVNTRFPDGRLILSIDTDAKSSYLVEAPGYGTHVVSADGTRVASVLPTRASWQWQRLLAAQALPLAAAAHGFEPLHASAVAIAGRAVAFTAPSGTGKTSIAMHLVARGAGLLTDDVLVVETTPSALLAHPGVRLLNANRAELAELQAGRERLGTTLGEEEKVQLRPPVEQAALPLAALYKLVREPAGARFRIVKEVPPDSRELLATGFLTYLKSPERLTRHLDFASRLAQGVPLFVVHLPADLSAARSAELLEQHVRDEV